jgi:hypothetical protein
MLGFSFRQTMSGTYWLLHAPAEEHAIGFTIEAAADDVASFARNRVMHLSGTMDADQLASDRPLEGSLAMKLLDERRIAYRVAFHGDDGRAYELSGQQEWSGLSPVASLTLLPASLYDGGGHEIGRAMLRFDFWSDWKRWLKSFRLRWATPRSGRG